MRPIGVLGAGAWGTALAAAAARAGNGVILCARDPGVADSIEGSRENTRHLPGVRLEPAIRCTADPGALAEADLILAAVPAQALRGALGSVAPFVDPRAPIVICAKGIERETGLPMNAVVRAVCPGHEPAALSGPSFAADVGLGLPTAVTLAARQLELAQTIAARLASPTLRLYHSDDLDGCEIGGAVKNVLAIACGIAEGRGLGASAVAALTARAFAELLRFGRAHGARAETLMGLSGFGDLVLTCRSAQSRNFAFGLALGQGLSIDEAGRGRLVEGAMTAPVVLRKARALGVAMPIVENVVAILGGRLRIEEAVDGLLARPQRAED